MPEALVLPSRVSIQGIQSDLFQNASAQLGCEVAAIQAVVSVEAPRGPFDDDGHPTLLFERHLFHRFTSGRFDMVAPNLSAATPGGYGKYSEQYGRLATAYLLSPADALRSASWGMFQILGDNHVEAGFSTVQEFAAAMCRSEADQFAAFVHFIAGNNLLKNALSSKDWVAFAQHYNGPGYTINQYDQKLRAAYQQHKG